MGQRNRRRHITPKRLRELWALYAAFRQGQLSPSTFKRDYGKVSRRLEKMEIAAPYLETAIEIRDWLLAHYATDTARRTLVQFNAAGKWAVSSDILITNPFDGVAQQIRKPRPTERQWAAFTIPERDRIIQEFELQHPYYAPWVKFLFWTAARPEEAAALRWEHCALDCTEILIQEAFPVDMHAPQSTKNYKTTRFPCNARLQRLLREQRPSEWSRDAFVFPGRSGGRFNYHNFQTRYWKPTLEDLVNRGRVAFYLPQYHCRHTWITAALEHLTVADVSYLARVSANVLYRHYAGRSRQILIPEF